MEKEGIIFSTDDQGCITLISTSSTSGSHRSCVTISGHTREKDKKSNSQIQSSPILLAFKRQNCLTTVDQLGRARTWTQ